MAIPAGTQLGNYEVIEPIGAGGMGEVYRARDPQLGRDVAIKVLPEDVSAQQEPLARFENEARLASSLSHPNIVTIYSLGWEGQRRYIAMEYIDGQTLQQLIEAGPMRVNEALNVAAQIADGLAKAHEAGIVHRDLKPKNVMLTKDGIAKILDFGLSKLAGPNEDPDARTGTIVDAATDLTKPGTILGTAEYMSPEQAAGRSLDFHSDQFSMGSLLYSMLTGDKPFHRETEVQTLSCIIESEPKPVSSLNPRVPHSLQAVIRRCMMKNPQDRYAATRELSRDLRELESALRMPGPYWNRREWLRVSIGFGMLLALVGGYWIWENRPYRPEPAALDWYEKGLAALHSMTFEAARKALEQAVAADPKFVLAQASLARAYDELGYSESAKESMLRALALAQEVHLSSVDEKRLRAWQYMVSRDFERAAPLLQQLEASAEDREKPAAALESGWLAQQREDTEGAAAAYQRAIRLAPWYAAAKLRLGFIQQRRGQNDQALENFAEAESLYNAASDHEGVTETLYQRANLWIRRGKAAEAISQITKAIAAAQTVGNRYQEIRLRLLQSAALRDLGQREHAADLAQKAIDEALAANMTNLASSGLVALGNSFLSRGDLEPAEKYFRSALELAQRGKVPRIVALASLSLGSLFEQKQRPEEARRFTEAAIPFYSQAGYRRELVQSKTILGGALDQLGEFQEGTKLLREALSGAEQLGDSVTEVRILERLSEILRDQGDWPAALRESERAASLVVSGSDSSDASITSAGLYCRLGRPDEAAMTLSAVEAIPKKDKDRRLASMIRLLRAETAYIEGRFDKAAAQARQGVSDAIANGEEPDPSLMLIEAMVSIRSGRPSEGLQSATRIIEEFEKAKLICNAAYARLSTAEALMAVKGNRSVALNMALEALRFFEGRAVLESIWRAHLVAAGASRQSSEVEAHIASARAALVRLREIWPAADIDSYLSRQDIKQLASRMQN